MQRLATHPGFTLVELLVVIVIIAILSALTLSGLAGARQRAKIDATRSTIRKLNEIIIPQYESYLRRRVPLPNGLAGPALARERLIRKRCLIVGEMPDRWVDVLDWFPNPPTSSPSAPPLITGPMLSYRAYKQQLSGALVSGSVADYYEGAECLAMIVMRGGFSEDVMEQFRPDETGDIDEDGAVEFWDAWGRPIDFIRWPAGFESVIQTRNSAATPDPFDPSGASGTREYPYGSEADFPPTTTPIPALPQRDYALVPLIYSAGPDEAANDPLGTASGYGIRRGGPMNGAIPVRWIDALRGAPPAPVQVLSTRVGAVTDMPGRVSDAAAFRDNITNHDLMKK